mmetsp:Transcript_24536/g.59067  ORF Transcript_24536/g.59067 Transcript_24536/m.59067 type:complete len:963 (+) Transcript_24536:192-3080(+)
MAQQQAMQALAQNLQATGSHETKKREAAEEWLKRAETQNGYSVMLLKLCTVQQVPLQTRQAGAIQLKNFVKKCWARDEDEKDRISKEDRTNVKSNITSVMLSTEERVRKQLGEAIHLICMQDFPKDWPNFLPDIVKRLSTNDPAAIVTILEVIESVVRRYRYETKSERLWTEVKFVLDTFAAPLLALLKKIAGLIPANAKNAVVLKQIFECLNQICQIFYSLASQDLPAFFEDNMDGFMGIFLSIINYRNDLLKPRDEDEPGLLEMTQAGVCNIARLYTDKYEEEFQPLVPKFVESIWKLLVGTNEKGRYDELVPTAIKFLTSVVEKEWHKKNFGNAKAIKDFAEKVIIPQLKLRENDQENFEYNGLEYVRRDMEGSDVDTRRRTTVDFIRGLCKFFEKEVTAIMNGYVEGLLKQYQANPEKDWALKDVAMYIVMALAIRGSTRQKGATQLNPHIKVMDFFKSQVITELKADPKRTPVLKADCLKFVASFRTHIPPEYYKPLIPIIATYLKHSNYVVHTYAAACIERLLSVKDNGQPRLSKQALAEYLKPLMGGLFQIFKHEDSKENEYGMKAVMRLCAVGEELLAGVAGLVIKSITGILSEVAKNPRNPNFNHYVFESLACLIENICKKNPQALTNFEQALFPPFETMLGMETCREFGPYVFQILSQLLEKHTKMTKPFQGIFRSLLHPEMWKNKGNVPAMIRLIVAYLKVDHTVIGSNLEGLLGIFQKLIASKREDHYGMALICAIIEHMPSSMWQKYAATFVGMMFQRLMKSSTPKFIVDFVGFVSFFNHKHGPDNFVQVCNNIQKGIFGNLLNKIIIQNIPKVSGKVERKSCAVGMTDLLCKSRIIFTGDFVKSWPHLLKVIVDLFELPEQSIGQSDEDIFDMSQRGFKTVYARLVFAPEPKYDPVGDVQDVKVYLAQNLANLSRQHPGKIMGIIGSMPQKYQSALQQYIQKAGVTLQ